MNRYVFYCLSVFFLAACNGGDGGDSYSSSSDSEIVVEVKSQKKGVALHYSVSEWPLIIADLQPYWHYNWDKDQSEYQPQGVEFVPMVWGKRGDIDEVVSDLTMRFQQGEFQYLLGFNEPDNDNQSNITVEDAIAQWKKLETIGVSMVSPATVHADDIWLQQFMQQANKEGLRVDYLAMHWYGNPNPSQFLTRVDEAYEQYSLPIWITEFAVADWDTLNGGENRWSESQVLSFMKTVLPELDKRDYVYRYAWFNGESEPLISSALIDADENLTMLGEYYSNYQPDTEIVEDEVLPEVPVEDADNLIEDGSFEERDESAWIEDDSNLANLNHTDIEDGYVAARLKSGDAELSQQITLEAGEVYIVELLAKWSEGSSGVVSVEIDGVVNDFEVPLVTSDEWQEIEFTIQAVESEVVELSIDKDSGGVLFIDDVSVTELE